MSTTNGNEFAEKGHAGTAAAGKPSFGQRLKAHYKKWWWLHVIFWLAVALLVTLLIIFVGFPKIAQKGVDDSTIELNQVTITDPTPKSIRIAQDAVTHSYSMYHPTLDAFEGSIALEGDVPYGTLTFPSIVSGDNVPAHIDQVLQITDMDAFVRYNKAFLGSKTFNQKLSGKTWLREGSLPATYVTYDKTVTLNGLNNLDGFKLTDFSIKTTAEPDGSNMVGNVFIPNPSVFTISMGNVTFNNYIDGEYIGNSTINNLVLKPGDNTLAMRSIVDQFKVLKFVQDKYKDFKLPVSIKGNASIANGEHLIYYEQPLQTSVRNITLNLQDGLPK